VRPLGGGRGCLESDPKRGTPNIVIDGLDGLAKWLFWGAALFNTGALSRPAPRAALVPVWCVRWFLWTRCLVVIVLVDPMKHKSCTKARGSPRRHVGGRVLVDGGLGFRFLRYMLGAKLS